MTKTTVRCPNTGCGRVTHLGEDSLGRIFRCPRCRTKLPSAPAAAADARWTAVLGPPRLGGRSFGLGPIQSWRASQAAPTSVGGEAWGSPGFESGEVLIGAFDFDGDNKGDETSGRGLGPDDSSEIVIEPFLSDGRSASGWNAGTKSSLSTMASNQSGASSISDDMVGAGTGGPSRFRIVSILGEGQHATVYRAYDPILERDVALKVPRRGVKKSANGVERFLGEAKALARLRHPRIVPIYEAGCTGDRHYIAMGLIEGTSLADRLVEGFIELPRAAEIVAELAEALAYAHGQGIVHRDVKPANIRLDGDGAVYLMDFGIAYRPDSGEIPLPPGMILGTPAYVAPEQAQGGQSVVLPASDQYSLGAVLYELLCGRPPFSGPPSYVLFNTIHHDPPSPCTIAPKIPRPLAAICLKALAKCPERRYAGCHEFAEDLRRWLRGEPPMACRRGWARLGK
jgi:eukaryotic-like serine/threonine-protein kinase